MRQGDRRWPALPQPQPQPQPHPVLGPALDVETRNPLKLWLTMSVSGMFGRPVKSEKRTTTGTEDSMKSSARHSSLDWPAVTGSWARRITAGGRPVGSRGPIVGLRGRTGG